MKKEYTQPEYLLCEVPIKDGGINDERIWIYHLPTLSLIEFICLNELDDFSFQGVQKDFIYQGNDTIDPEAWKGVFVQNNCEVAGKSEDTVIVGAWEYLESYLKWEDDRNT